MKKILLLTLVSAPIFSMHTPSAKINNNRAGSFYMATQAAPYLAMGSTPTGVALSIAKTATIMVVANMIVQKLDQPKDKK